jgi:hypothetical protein
MSFIKQAARHRDGKRDENPEQNGRHGYFLLQIVCNIAKGVPSASDILAVKRGKSSVCCTQ